MDHIEIEQEDDGITFDIESDSTADEDIQLNNTKFKNQSLRRGNNNFRRQPPRFRQPMVERLPSRRPYHKPSASTPMPLGDDTFEMLGNPNKRIVQDENDEEFEDNFQEESNQYHHEEPEQPIMEEPTEDDY